VIFLVIFVVTAAALIVLLWVGAAFLQGYIYTEPSPELYWQAPAAGAALALFITLWCVLVANAVDPKLPGLPYDTLFRFSPRVERSPEPVKELIAETKTGPVRYIAKKNRNRLDYKTENGTGWPRSPVSAIIIKEKDEELRLEPLPPTEGSPYQEFAGDGWVMKVVDDGPTGMLLAFRWGRFLFNLFLNFVHFALWFVCLWLLLRFQWSHALGLAVVMWLIMTVAILPMVLDQAGASGQKRPTTAERGERFQIADFRLQICMKASGCDSARPNEAMIPRHDFPTAR